MRRETIALGAAAALACTGLFGTGRATAGEGHSRGQAAVPGHTDGRGSGVQMGIRRLRAPTGSRGHRAKPARRERRAWAAHTLSGTETAHLQLMRQRETHLFEEGRATGTLPGGMRANLVVGALFRGGFTIATRGGTIRGRGTAKPHGTGRFQSFAGTLRITGGSGRYRRIHGKMSLYGTFDRRTFAVVIKAHGRLRY